MPHRVPRCLLFSWSLSWSLHADEKQTPFSSPTLPYFCYQTLCSLIAALLYADFFFFLKKNRKGGVLVSAVGCFVFWPKFLAFCLLCTVMPFVHLFTVFSVFCFLGHTCLSYPLERICLIKMLPVVSVTEEPITCFHELCRVMRQYLGFWGEAGKGGPLAWQIIV